MPRKICELDQNQCALIICVVGRKFLSPQSAIHELKYALFIFPVCTRQLDSESKCLIIMT